VIAKRNGLAAANDIWLISCHSWLSLLATHRVEVAATKDAGTDLIKLSLPAKGLSLEKVVFPQLKQALVVPVSATGRTLRRAVAHGCHSRLAPFRQSYRPLRQTRSILECSPVALDRHACYWQRQSMHARKSDSSLSWSNAEAASAQGLVCQRQPFSHFKKG
jgi:hypothetical protein